MVSEFTNQFGDFMAFWFTKKIKISKTFKVFSVQ